MKLGKYKLANKIIENGKWEIRIRIQEDGKLELEFRKLRIPTIHENGINYLININ